ncbi:MAG: hypothetical protein OEU48_12160, partial [Gammaproteobacteria bacterium]|nr:hypothetical protein [Gammaproteobacteria bacterium]
FEHEALAGLDLDVDVDNTSDWFNVFTATRVGRGQVQLESIFRRGIEQSQVISRVRSRRPL